MSEDFHAAVRGKARAFLTAALKAAIASYEFYQKHNNDRDEKKFAAYHKDLKICLAHIDKLVETARKSGVAGDTLDRAEHILKTHGAEALAEWQAFESGCGDGFESGFEGGSENGFGPGADGPLKDGG